MALPKIELMQPTLLARAFHRDGWVYEEKYDGWRMLAYTDGDNVRLVGRPGNDHTRRFVDLVNVIRSLDAETLILDGEVAILDNTLVSRFEWMRHGKPPGIATPPLFMAFDCLCVMVHVDPYGQGGEQHHRVGPHAHDGLPMHVHE